MEGVLLGADGKAGGLGAVNGINRDKAIQRIGVWKLDDGVVFRHVVGVRV